MGVKVANNAWGTLAAGITNVAASLSLTAGQGARFPVLAAGQWFWATLSDASNNLEIVKVTATSGDTFTITRGQDGTAARAYSLGDRIELRPTAALFNDKADKDAPTFTGTTTLASPTATWSVAGWNKQLEMSDSTVVRWPVASGWSWGIGGSLGSFYIGKSPANDASGGITYPLILAGATGNATFAADVTAATFTGNGSALTNLNASNLASGTVPSARVAGAYAGITQVGTLAQTLTCTGNGIFQGGDLYNYGYGGNTNHAVYRFNQAGTAYIFFNGAFNSTGGDWTHTGNFTATQNITAYSDVRYKDNIETIADALAKLRKIRGVTYNRIDLFASPRHAGVIAQEVKEVLPEVVEEDVTGIMSVAYGNLNALLIEAVKELDAKVEKLAKKAK